MIVYSATITCMLCRQCALHAHTVSEIAMHVEYFQPTSALNSECISLSAGSHTIHLMKHNATPLHAIHSIGLFRESHAAHDRAGSAGCMDQFAAMWSGTHPRPPMGRWTPGAISLVGIGRGAAGTVVATAVATRAASEATMLFGIA